MHDHAAPRPWFDRLDWPMAAFALASLLLLRLTIPTIGVSLPLVDGLLEPSGCVIGRDFANLWTGGRAALTGDYGALFDADRHTRELARLLHPDLVRHYWSYPPTAFWLGLPLAALPYAAALALWTLAGLAAIAWTLMRAGPSWRATAYLVLIFASPPGVIALLFGQTALLTTAALIAGLTLAGTRPRLAGALLGLMVIKPHLGLVVPLALAARRQWPAFIATAGCALAYLAATVAAFGLEPWRLFVDVTLPQQAQLLGVVTEAMNLNISPFMLVRALGFEQAPALAVHGAIALLGLAAAFSIMRSNPSPEVRLVAFSLATLIASPYVLAYELVLVFTALALWALTLDRDGRQELVLPTLVLLVVLAPAAVYHSAAGRDCGLIPAVLILALAALWVLVPRAAAIGPSDGLGVEPFRPAPDPNPAAL